MTVARSVSDVLAEHTVFGVESIPGTHRYHVTDDGLHTAKFLTTVQHRLLPTGLAELANPHPVGQLKSAATAYRKAVDTLTVTTQFAA